MSKTFNTLKTVRPSTSSKRQEQRLTSLINSLHAKSPNQSLMRTAIANEQQLNTHLSKYPTNLPQLLGLLKEKDMTSSSDLDEFTRLFVSQHSKLSCSLSSNIVMMK